MPIDFLKTYLNSDVYAPYFLFVGDEEYLEAINDAKLCGLDIVPVSHFCGEPDKIPDIDGLIDLVKLAEEAESAKKFAIIGLGEFLGLSGTEETTRVLAELKNAKSGKKKVVVILRGLTSQIAALERDPRFDNRRHGTIDKANCNLSFTLLPPAKGSAITLNLQSMLEELEAGKSGNVVYMSTVHFNHSLFTVHRINDPYEGIRFFVKGFALDSCCGTEEQWAALFSELTEAGYSLETVFKKHKFAEKSKTVFYVSITGKDYQSWLYFIYLKNNVDALQNRYLRFVLERTSCFEELPGSILNAIIDIPHTDSRFPLFNQGRQELVEKFPESDIASFVLNNRKVVSESIYKLTDHTRVEREEIVAWTATNGIIPEIGEINPALAAYCKKYVFRCSELADLLTEYFEAYKRQKLSNRLEPAFLERVDELACSRRFNRLSTRNDILDHIDKSEAYLCWVDALGVEYLSLIESLAQQKGLSISISVARAELPTITTVNRDFYDSWPGQKEKNGDLDDIKHHDAGGYKFSDNQLPIHLAEELRVITEIMENAATKLAFKHCKRFLIVSDHGASRLAVLRRKEEKYDTDTPGKHSGRCCKLFEPYDLPFAAESRGYLVLADYGRFKGSRAANVEVHGGASLEEVVIPIIELSLKDSNIFVKLTSGDMPVTADPRIGAEIELFINSPVKQVLVAINGKFYSAIPTDENHHHVKLPDIKRAGKYPADVYAGDDLIGKIIVSAQGRIGTVDDSFDALFS